MKRDRGVYIKYDIMTTTAVQPNFLGAVKIIMKEFQRSDVSVLIEMISRMTKSAKYQNECGAISDAVYMYIVDPLHLRCNDVEINQALDGITMELLGESNDNQ